MKAFLKLCAICLITFLLVSPALVVWKVWQNHSDLLLRQRIAASGYLVASSDLAGDLASDLPIDSPDLPSAALSQLASATLIQQPIQSPQPQQIRLFASAVIIPAYLGFMGAVLLGFYTGFLLNNHHQTRRHLALKQQVATLEKIWQQSIY